jgi:hypothetical protein
MWKIINTALDGFVLGLLVEYTYRVEVNPFAIGIGVLVLVSIILELWLYRHSERKANLLVEVNERLVETIRNDEKLNRTIPKGWMVYEAGQDPLHMLWFIRVISFDDLVDDNITDKRQVLIEEGNSYEEVLKMAIIRIKRDNV